MNYFGHAVVASWSAPPPAMVLGAMLPDFMGMCGARIAEASDPDVAAGIDFHHAVDRTFHALPIVVGLMRELDERLARAGCARGPRRATAHIGIELLLDGTLVGTRAYRDAYTTALAHDAKLAFRDPAQEPRYALLMTRLRQHGPPDDLRDPASITHRLERVLSSRKLLAPSAADLCGIHTALAAQQPRVEAASPTVMHALQGTVQGATTMR